MRCRWLRCQGHIYRYAIAEVDASDSSFSAAGKTTREQILYPDKQDGLQANRDDCPPDCRSRPPNNYSYTGADCRTDRARADHDDDLLRNHIASQNIPSEIPYRIIYALSGRIIFMLGFLRAERNAKGRKSGGKGAIVLSEMLLESTAIIISLILIVLVVQLVFFQQ